MQTTANFPHSIRAYLDEIIELAKQSDLGIVSIAVFGSSAKGGYSEPISDVDLVVALANETPRKFKRMVERQLVELELKHGFRERPANIAAHLRSGLDHFAGQFKSGFVCYERDLLAGRGAVMFGWRPVSEYFFSTRIILANIAVSTKIIWGEDLFARTQLRPIGRRHLASNFRAFFLINLLALLTFLFNPKATKYSMSTLKWMLHNCHFCYTGQPATLQQEVEFFSNRLGQNQTLTELMSLRQNYRSSIGFVMRNFGALIRLFATTLKDNRFPIRPCRELGSKELGVRNARDSNGGS